MAKAARSACLVVRALAKTARLVLSATSALPLPHGAYHSASQRSLLSGKRARKAVTVESSACNPSGPDLLPDQVRECAAEGPRQPDHAT